MERRTRALLAATAVAVATTLAVVAPAGAAKRPVKLEGTVNAEGTENVSKQAEPELTMDLADFSFGPTFVKAKAGSTVTVELENTGNVPHTFTSDALEVDESLSAGDRTSVEVTVPSTGKAFRFYCRFHQGSGMQGAFFTKAGARPAASSSSSTGSGGTGSGSGSGSDGTPTSGAGSLPYDY